MTGGVYYYTDQSFVICGNSTTVAAADGFGRGRLASMLPAFLTLSLRDRKANAGKRFEDLRKRLRRDRMH